MIAVGECFTPDLQIHETNGLIWTTGNQDIASVEVTMGKGTVCGVNQGITYVSAGSINGEFNFHLPVKVSPKNSDQSSVQPIKSSKVILSINPEAEQVLQEIIASRQDIDYGSLLKVADSRRYLVYRASDEPFLFLSQTLWSMTRRLSREDIINVLDICKAQNFTAIQIIAHSHYMGPNVYGDEPFKNADFTFPVITPGISIYCYFYINSQTKISF